MCGGGDRICLKYLVTAVRTTYMTMSTAGMYALLIWMKTNTAGLCLREEIPARIILPMTIIFLRESSETVLTAAELIPQITEKVCIPFLKCRLLYYTEYFGQYLDVPVPARNVSRE